MHPARLSYLAYTYPVKRRVVEAKRNSRGHWELSLECGHVGTCVGHMDASKAVDWNCADCSVKNVKTNPRWAEEFKETDHA